MKISYDPSGQHMGYTLRTNDRLYSFDRNIALSLMTELDSALDAGKIAERNRFMAAKGIAHGDKLAATAEFLALLESSTRPIVWVITRDAYLAGDLSVNLFLSDADTYLKDRVGVYCPQLPRERILVTAEMAQAMKALWDGQHQDGS